MADIPPLPDGYSLDPTAAGSAVPENAPPLPSGYSLTDPAQQPPAPPAYVSSILPFTYDAAGQRSFDPSVGLLGQAISAVTAPSDAVEGKMMPSYGNPDATNRALNFAMMFGPQSVATRAGEIVPGAATMQQAPTAQQLKAAATKGYDAARASDIAVPADAISAFSRGLQQQLQSESGIIPKTAPKTFAILDELGSPPDDAIGTYPGLEAARRGLSAIAGEGGTEGFAAQKAITGLDPFIDSISPAAAYARANYAAAMRSNALTGELDKANTGILEKAEGRAEASHSGRNIDNAIRQRVESFLESKQKTAGFSPDELDALRAVVAGGPVQNTARFASNLLGGGGGIGQSIIGGMIGGHFGGAEGVSAGMAAPMMAGTALKTFENALARRSLNSADELVRMNSPLARALQTEGLLMQPAMGRNSAVFRTLLPGLLAPQPQSAPTTGLLGGGWISA